MLFGFGKRKTVEAMLAELAALGISLRPGVTVDQLVTTVGRAKVEKGGFELLLAVMGDEPFEPETLVDLDPLSDDVWHFDVEAIEDHGAYVRIVNNCCRLTGNDLKFDAVKDFVDVDRRIAWVEVSKDGHTQHIDLKVDDDWVDPEIFKRLRGWLAETGSKRRFAAQSLGQDMLIICKQAEEIKAINRATGLSFRENI